MPKPSVLIIEDEELQRRSLERELRHANFEVVACEDATGARREVARRGTPFDVVVLDMNLDREALTGAELGQEFLARDDWKRRPPEFLINTAYSAESYYEQALKLGAAAYLRKGRTGDLTYLVDHVRVLALRRALSLDNEDILERSRSIAAERRDGWEAFRSFCEQVLLSAFREFLSLEALFLLTIAGQTRSYSTSTQALTGAPSSDFATIQALVQGSIGRCEPFVVDARLLEKVRLSPESRTASMLRSVDRGAFISLVVCKNMRLSVGILPASSDAEDTRRAVELSQLVQDFLRPIAHNHLFLLLAQGAELAEKRHAVLTATAVFCNYVGQQQLAALDAAGDIGEIVAPGQFVGKLQSLAQDLVASGGLLGELIRVPMAYEARLDVAPVNELVASAWREVCRVLAEDASTMLSISGEAQAQCRREYLQLAMGRILLWFARRQVALAPGVKRAIVVQCFNDPSDDRTVVLQIEDGSPRLPGRLREHLMEPFASVALDRPAKEDLAGPGQHLALYLAKMLIEEGCQGRVLDRSEELEGEVGHRIVVRLPSAMALDAMQVA